MQYNTLLKTVGLIALSLAGIILLYFALEPITDHLNEAGYFWLSIISNASLAVAIYFLVRWFNKKVNHLRADNYGFGSKRMLRNFFMGCAVAIFLIFLTLLVTSFFSGVRLDFIGLKEGHITTLVEFIVANLVVAVWEEIYFRGLVVNTLLSKNLSFIWTAIISSGFFTLVHISSYDMATITPYWMAGVFLISTVLLLLYVLTGSIWTSIGCHFCWDTLFMSFDERENDFGIIQMKTYVTNATLIDNISILVTGAVLALFFILCRDKITSSAQLYVSQVGIAR